MKNFFRRILKGYYTYLLLFLFVLFAIRPYEQSLSYLVFWKFFSTFAFLSAIFNCKHHRGVRISAFVLAFPTLLFGWYELFFPSNTLFVITICFAIIFMALCTVSTLYDVIRRARVTLETLRGIVCAYFMIAFVFAYIYYLLEYLIPGSFHLLVRDEFFVTFSRNLSQFMYFSFVTLLTIGYGDITPLLDVSQTAVVLEGIIGQFYIAILVAKIVAVYSISTERELLTKFESDLAKKKK
ncbi:MAG TPA: ion channel [Rhabdochlamydiaceae bacterium]|nr:ion channel [Rhabdochlamydiaceae bacterium]